MIKHGRAVRRDDGIRARFAADSGPRLQPAGTDLDAMLWRFMEQAINGQALSRAAMEQQVLSQIAFAMPSRPGDPAGAGD